MSFVVSIGVERSGRVAVSVGDAVKPFVACVSPLWDTAGLYDGRPERYFDNRSDPRAKKQEVEDSDYTRQV